MRILFVGEIGVGQTSHMRMRALMRLGHEVQGLNTSEPWRRAMWHQRQLQRRLAAGSIVQDINNSVLRLARDFKPDIIWAEKQEFLQADTIESLRRHGAKLIHYTPDPYFTVQWKRTRLMDRAITEFDVLIYCKAYEKNYYEAIGKPLIYMPLGYCDEVHRPVPSCDSQWTCAVGFLGGWEPRRERLLKAIADRGIDLKFRGYSWDFVRDGRWTPRRYLILRQLAGEEDFHIRCDEALAASYNGDEVYADDYARALTGAAIGLGLLRTAWPDTHTTRSFEIPACGSLLLADRTDEHCALFREGQEADFFSSEEEMIEKINYYTQNNSARRRLSEAGQERCTNSRYAYIHRLSDALDELRKY